jgi:hypothetical protein
LLYEVVNEPLYCLIVYAPEDIVWVRDFEVMVFQVTLQTIDDDGYNDSLLGTRYAETEESY